MISLQGKKINKIKSHENYHETTFLAPTPMKTAPTLHPKWRVASKAQSG